MNITFLDPAAIRFEEAPDGTLRLELPDRCGLQVEAMLAFPLSHPREHIVLRDGGGAELGVIEKLDSLDGVVSAIIEAQIHRRYFLPQVTGIYDVSERFGSSVWDLETDRGRRLATTRIMNEAVAEVYPGRYIITDVENNRYEIKDFSLLDPASQARFQGKI